MSIHLDFPTEAIWKSKASAKAWFLAWLATKGKIPMFGKLKRINFKLAGAYSASFKEEQYTNHLFVHCWCVYTVWHLSLSLMGVSFGRNLMLKEMFWWHGEEC